MKRYKFKFEDFDVPYKMLNGGVCGVHTEKGELIAEVTLRYMLNVAFETGVTFQPGEDFMSDEFKDFFGASEDFRSACENKTDLELSERAFHHIVNSNVSRNFTAFNAYQFQNQVEVIELPEIINEDESQDS